MHIRTFKSCSILASHGIQRWVAYLQKLSEMSHTYLLIALQCVVHTLGMMCSEE